MEDYRVLVGSLRDNTWVEELPVTRVNYSKVLNGPGKCDISTSPDPRNSLLAKKITETDFEPGRTVIYIEKNGTIVWAGILWEVFVVFPSNRLRLIGEGLWSYFRHRHITTTVTYNSTDQFAVAKALIDTAIGKPAGNVANISTAATPTSSGVNVTRRYPGYQYRQVAEAIEDLGNRTGGFDFDITSTWSTTEAGVVDNKFELYYPSKGTRTEVVFDYPANVTRIQWRRKGQKFANTVHMIGAGSGEATTTASAVDVGSFTDNFPLLEQKLMKKDISVSSTLVERANRELNRRNQVEELIDIDVDAKSIETSVGSFTVGDIVRVRGSNGYLDINKLYRIMSYLVVVDQGANSEKISVIVGTVEATED